VRSPALVAGRPHCFAGMFQRRRPYEHMEPYRVFVSSIMNRDTEDLLAEREAARAAIEHFAPIATAWAFETEPASPKPLLEFYIDAVKTSDLLVLILGQRVTKPVKDEYTAARDHNKPVLAFFKTVPSREPDADAIRTAFHAKYEGFDNAVELKERVRRALGLHLLGIVRGDEGQASRQGDRVARLRKFEREHRELKLSPTIPCDHHNSFRVQSVGDTAVIFRKGGIEDILVPIERIGEVLDPRPDEPAHVVSAGRLQWLTIDQRWRFFLEKPPSPDPLCAGIGKLVPYQGELVNRIGGLLRRGGTRFQMGQRRERSRKSCFLR
jgi:Domain of unknown function (DUF4062)